MVSKIQTIRWILLSILMFSLVVAPQAFSSEKEGDTIEMDFYDIYEKEPPFE